MLSYMLSYQNKQFYIGFLSIYLLHLGFWCIDHIVGGCLNRGLELILRGHFIRILPTLVP